ECAGLSSTLANFASASNLNVLWGWTSDRFGGPELRLFPGAIAIALAAVALLRRPSRMVVIYLLVAGAAIELSFGANGFVYRSLAGHVTALQGFRSWSRFGILAMFGIAVLSGFGTLAILESVRPQRRTVTLV